MSRTHRAIGIDIGGTKTTVAAVDGRGSVHAKAEFATRSRRGFAICRAELVACAREVMHNAHWTPGMLAAIGVGCAGPVNPQRGTIHNPYTLPGWDAGVDLVTPLREAYGVPVRLENDADAAAMGEFQWGAGRGASPMVMVTLGTGVGGAAIVNGLLYRGLLGGHPEIGHLPVQPEGPACYCGTRGCWESLASGTAIAAAGEPFGFEDCRAVFAAAAANAHAAAIIRRAMEATATASWSLLHTFLPERIVLGGGLGEDQFDRFAPALLERIACATQVPPRGIEVLRAQLGKTAGVIGAACLALQNTQPSLT